MVRGGRRFRRPGEGYMSEPVPSLRRLTIVGLLMVMATSMAIAYLLLRPRRYPLLDSRLGASAWQPTNLLTVLAWEYHDKGTNPLSLGYPDFFDFQHQALLRLLDIQKREFGLSTAPRATNGTYIDHSGVWLVGRTNSQIIVIGTGTLKPVYFKHKSLFDQEGYWQEEQFTFAPDGRLLSRESHTQ